MAPSPSWPPRQCPAQTGPGPHAGDKNLHSAPCHPGAFYELFFFFFLPFPFPFLSQAWRFEEPGCNKVGFRDQRGPEIPRASGLRALCPPLPPPNTNIRANHPPHNANL